MRSRGWPISRRHYQVTLADAFLAHDEALTFGGREGVSSMHLIESAIARPYCGYYKPIASKAAALLHSMVSNHGFVDGNKRTAWILTELLINRSDYQLVISETERIDDLVVAVADSSLRFEKIVLWFEQHIWRAT